MKVSNLIKKLFTLWFLTIVLLQSNLLWAQAQDKQKAISAGAKDFADLRDPFKREYKKEQLIREKGGKMLINNKFSNLPTIESIKLDQIKIVGVLLGEKRRAMAKVVDSSGVSIGKDTYIIKEGMKLGLNKAEVKAIVPGGIVLVEKIRNIYDQDEYIETVIPISSAGGSTSF